MTLPLGKTAKIVDRRGFTLVEILVVTVVLAILMSLIVSAVHLVLRNAEKVRTSSLIVTSHSAIGSFETDYGRHPVVRGTGGDEGVESAAESKLLFDILQGREVSASPQNYKKIDYGPFPLANGVTKPSSGIGAASSSAPGAMMDAWGNVIRFGWDYDHDYLTDLAASIHLTYGDEPSTRSSRVIAVSVGPDATPGKGGNLKGSDDVVSWR